VIILYTILTLTLTLTRGLILDNAKSITNALSNGDRSMSYLRLGILNLVQFDP